MKIGIIGSGNMGGGLGKLWAAKGHQLVFSDTHDATHLPELVQAAGANAQAGSPADAAAFGDVVLLTVRWPDAAPALSNLTPHLVGKTLVSCINPFKPDFSGLEVGTTTSGAEEIAKLVPGARVVECLFVNATVVNSPTRQFGAETPTVHTAATTRRQKAMSPRFSPTSASNPGRGTADIARYMEPAMMLLMMLGCRPAGRPTSP